MKNVGFELDQIISQRRLKQKDVADMLGMSSVNLSKILKKESIDAELLEKITTTLRIPISHFFESEEVLELKQEKKSNICPACKEKERLIQQLQDQLKDKERLIQILENKDNQKEAC